LPTKKQPARKKPEKRKASRKKSSATSPRPRGPAARAKAAGKSYNVKLLPHAFTPLAHDDGTPRSKIQPYLPVLQTCEVCPARCCRFNVKVSLADAVHYCTTLGVPFFEGMHLVPSDHKHHSFEVERDPILNPEEEGWTGRAEIQLRRKEDGSCHALVEIGGYERCGVYEARPTLCRLYPMSWTSDVAKGGPAVVVCPVPYGVTEASERQFVHDVGDARRHRRRMARARARERPADRSRLPVFRRVTRRRAHGCLRRRDPLPLCRVIAWEGGTFEFGNPEEEAEFELEMEDTTEVLLKEAMKQLEEFRKVASELPPPHEPLRIAQPLEPSLTELKASDLELLQIVHNYGYAQHAFDMVPGTDAEIASALLALFSAGYIESAE